MRRVLLVWCTRLSVDGITAGDETSGETFSLLGNPIHTDNPTGNVSGFLLNQSLPDCYLLSKIEKPCRRMTCLLVFDNATIHAHENASRSWEQLC